MLGKKPTSVQREKTMRTQKIKFPPPVLRGQPQPSHQVLLTQTRTHYGKTRSEPRSHRTELRFTGSPQDLLFGNSGFLVYLGVQSRSLDWLFTEDCDWLNDVRNRKKWWVCVYKVRLSFIFKMSKLVIHWKLRYSAPLAVKNKYIPTLSSAKGA